MQSPTNPGASTASTNRGATPAKTDWLFWYAIAVMLFSASFYLNDPAYLVTTMFFGLLAWFMPVWIVVRLVRWLRSILRK